MRIEGIDDAQASFLTRQVYKAAKKRAGEVPDPLRLYAHSPPTMFAAGFFNFAAFVALQLWSVAGDSDRKDVSMMMIKPMVTYDLNEKWKAVYMPYGVSVYWNKPSGQRVYFPLGGGIQRQFNIGSVPSAFSVQLFKNVIRPDKGTKYDFRLMLEVNF